MLNRSKNKLIDVNAFCKPTYYYNCRVINHVLLHILFLTLYFDYFENIIRTEDELSGLFIIWHNEELYSLYSHPRLLGY
jgi:undecaprenyl pyrophosphate synthase